MEEINKKIQEFLSYDEYRWQYDTKLAITYNKRAEGLELPLYQCKNCKTEFEMETKGTKIFCKHCHSSWNMSEYGRLENDKESIHITDWYEWERENVIKEIEDGKYNLDTKVNIESLPNAINFINLGEGILKHNTIGFYLTFKDYGENNKKTLYFPPLNTLSVHTEYNYRGKGQCITLSTLDNTYFLFPKEKIFNSTKIQFATEYLYKISKDKIKINNNIKIY